MPTELELKVATEAAAIKLSEVMEKSKEDPPDSEHGIIWRFSMVEVAKAALEAAEKVRERFKYICPVCGAENRVTLSD